MRSVRAELDKCLLKLTEPIMGACVSCTDSMYMGKLTKLSCQHHYCRSCLREMTSIAMKNEAQFPPKCCTTEIPSETIITSLKPADKELFLTKTREFQTPPADRWYCPSGKCGKWIPQPRPSQRQRCPHCSIAICPKCRGQKDSLHECYVADPELGAVLEEATRKGWKRCYNCRSLVESTGGCDHMNCRCGAEFCYKCGESVEECQCVDSTLHYRPRQAQRPANRD